MPDFWLGSTAASRGFRLLGFDSVGSTNTEAVRAARAGDVGNVWFAALQQTEGRGRRGRAWETAPGNLAASLLVVPGVEPDLCATLGFVAGVALQQALAPLVQAPGRSASSAPGVLPDGVALKWPNDILVGGAKLAGILLEAQKRQDGDMAVVVGIGVNVVAAPTHVPYRTTSLYDLGCATTAPEVFATLTDRWVECVDLWDQGRGLGAVMSLWRDYAAGLGGAVAVNRGGETVRGIFETIDEAGRLIVRANDNQRIAVTAGDVHFGTTASEGI